MKFRQDDFIEGGGCSWFQRKKVKKKKKAPMSCNMVVLGYRRHGGKHYFPWTGANRSDAF